MTWDKLAAKEKALIVYQRLLDYFGRPDWGGPSDPLDELVSTILSQNTNDRNRDRAFNNLRAQYKSWEAVRDAAPQQVIDAIRSAGLANQKGPRIQAVLQKITREQGSLSLEFLKQLQPDEVRRWLLNLDGVGPKTTSIVMLFSLGLPAFPVDTHIYRVSGRLGLRPENITVEQAHDYLAELFSVSDYGPAHLNLIRLGREICHARQPNCAGCLLNDMCDYAVKQP